MAVPIVRSVVAALAAWAILTVAPDLIRPFAPLGTIGLHADFGGRVDVVDPGGPAAAAGVRPMRGSRAGDRVDFARTSSDTLFALYGGLGGRILFPVGQPTRLTLISADGTVRTVTLVAIETKPTVLDRVRLFLAEVFGLAFIVLATFLAWTFPRRRDVFGFFLYAIWFNPGENYVVYSHLPNVLRPAQELLSAFAQAAGLAGFMLFALRFPTDRSEGPRRAIERMLPVFVVLLTVLTVMGSGAVIGHPNRSLWLTTFWLKAAIYPLIVAAFLTKLRGLPPVDRQRLRLVIYGCIPGLFFYLLAESVDATSLWAPVFDRFAWRPAPELIELAYLVNALVPVSIAYAVLRQRVLPIDFILNRALTMGIVFTIVAFAFEAALLTTHSFLEHQDIVSTTLLAAAFVAIAPLIEWIKRIVHRCVDGLLFARLHRARAQLTAIGSDLVGSASITEIETALVEAPYQHLRLAAAALFVLDESGSAYLLTVQRDWPRTAFTTIAAGDELLAKSAVTTDAKDVHDVVLSRGDMPAGAARPNLVIPLAPHDLGDAIVVYGGHADGTALSPEEKRVVRRFVRECAAVRAHLQALAMRREIAELRRARTGVPRGAV